MTSLQILVGLVAAARLIEAVLERRADPRFVPGQAAWLAAVALYVPAEAQPFPALVAVLAVLQALRAAALGWPVLGRVLADPLQVVATVETAVLPLAFGAVWIGFAFTALDAALRAALTPARPGATVRPPQ